MRRRPIILVVEDDADTAALLRRILPRWGYDVRSASNLAEARRAVEAGPFDLLLSDLVLPDGDGVDLCRQLQLHHHVPAIAVTGYNLHVPEDAARCKEAGFDRRLAKPVDMDLLFLAIQNTLAAASAADDAEEAHDSCPVPEKVL